ncbi:MAG: DUF6064 family protein [Rhodospirillaceae bacterium]|nr:DUF6064 family protein [Rhodospirillaceae bacterium]MDE0618488.1 DUF6064 family protein [Rhodospirillaceae bacterium]
MAGSWAPEDFLLFSPRAYWRLFALENAAAWPAQLLLIAAGAVLLFGMVRGRRPSGRWGGPALGVALGFALGAAWLWAGWQFLALRYGAINWAAPMLAWGFYAEGALLAALGMSGRLAFTGRGTRARAGIGLLAAALFAWPLLAPLDGRPWQEAEVFAIAPDPTAIATLALLALAPRSRWTAPLAVVPALWLAISALTLFTMGAWQGWAVFAALIAGLVACTAPGRETAGGL